MISKDKETIALKDKTDCDGQVEVWLNRLLDSMQATIRDRLDDAVNSYEDKPRDQWIFDFPAQIAFYSF